MPNFNVLNMPAKNHVNIRLIYHFYKLYVYKKKYRMFFLDFIPSINVKKKVAEDKKCHIRKNKSSGSNHMARFPAMLAPLV
jgi:hypothetical protein